MKRDKKSGDLSKEIRQEKILDIISERDIETQAQLVDALREYGYDNTQATVSRDIRELGLTKELSESGRYRYSQARVRRGADNSIRLRTIFRESVTSFSRAQNIVVIKTLPGLAPAACSAIDGMDIPDLVGTIAGDDTAFLAMTDNDAAAAFCNEIKQML